MPLDAAYISHSEIQWGLSPDGERWAEDAEARLRGYLDWVSSLGPGAAIAQACDASGALLGAAVVLWMADTPAPHAILQDIVAAPEARGRGVGGALLRFIEAAAKARGLGWLFLESGARNSRAHAFFAREGYDLISHTFAKRLR